MTYTTVKSSIVSCHFGMRRKQRRSIPSLSGQNLMHVPFRITCTGNGWHVRVVTGFPRE